MNESIITQLHGISPEELKASIISDMRNELKKLADNFNPAPAPQYLTRQELSKILKVSLVTLNDWNKKEIIKPYRLGNLIRYKQSEVDKALIAINKK